MKFNTIKVSRRQVLRGAGGFTLGLPFLPSLATPKNALGAVAAPVRRRFVSVIQAHGGLRPETFHWEQSMPRSEMLFSGHTIRAADLSPRTEGGNTVFSSALQAPSSILTSALVEKMNVYRAVDNPFSTDHTTGSPLGNFSRSGDNSEFKGEDPRQTIDNLLGYSPTFYDSLDGIKERVLLLGTRAWENEFSWRYSSPTLRSGSLVPVACANDPAGVWDRVFKGFSPSATPAPATPTPAAPKPIIDLVLEDYRRISKGNVRLSAEDRQRLADHVDRLAELERKVGTVSAPPTSGVSCKIVPGRTSIPCNVNAGYCAGDARKYLDVFTDLLAAAFTCGLSRVGGLFLTQPFVASFSGDWHQQVAHTGDQRLLGESHRNIFAYGVAALAKKLDIEEANGRTFLDNTLIMSTNECGMDTHHGLGLPMVTFGGAGGSLKTGQLIDFRKNAGDSRSNGITANQWLAIVLQSLGIPRSEFETGGQQGYGRMKLGKNFIGKYVPDAISQASRIPTLLQA